MKRWQFEVGAETGIGITVASLSAALYLTFCWQVEVLPVVNVCIAITMLTVFCCLALVITACYCRRSTSGLLMLWAYALVSVFFAEFRLFLHYYCISDSPVHGFTTPMLAVMGFTVFTARLLRLKSELLEAEGETRIE